MKSCLIVVDYQKDFVTGALGFEKARALDALIARKIREYREKGGEIIFTLDTHGEDYYKTQEGRCLAVAHCISGTEGHELYGETGALMNETDKRFYKGAFGSGELYNYLLETPFESIELVGLITNVCVIANAVLAKTARPETPVIIDADCTASNDEYLHRAALDVMDGLQIRISRRGLSV